MTATVFHSFGAFVAHRGNAEDYYRHFAANGGRAIALLAFESGGTPGAYELVRRNEPWDEAAATIRAAGLEPVPWGVFRALPGDETLLLLEAARIFGTTHGVINAEAAHKGDDADETGAGNPARTIQVVEELDRAAPDFRALWSTFGGASGLNVLGHPGDWPDGPARGPMRFGPWLRRGDTFGAQCYPNEVGDDMRPSTVLEHARRAGIPTSQMQITPGTYDGPRGRWTADDYVNELIAHGAPPPHGLWLYTLEQTPWDDIARWGELLRLHQLVLEPGQEIPSAPEQPVPPPPVTPAPETPRHVLRRREGLVYTEPEDTPVSEDSPEPEVTP